MEPELKPFVTAMILFAAILCIYAALFAHSAPMINQDSSDQPVGEIYGATLIGQSFTATENRVHRIDVCLATYARKNTHDVLFTVREEGSSEDIINIVVNAARIENNAYHRFSFNPIPDSRGKSYVLSIQSPNSSLGNAITAWYTQEEAYANGTAIINSIPIEGDLRFGVFYEISLLEFLLSSFTKFFEDIVFAISYTLLVFVVIFGIIYVKILEYKKGKSN